MKPDLWINGAFVPWDKACVHPLCHSLQRGATLFESIDCKEASNGKAAIFRLRDHMVRFEHSADIVGMKLPYDLDALVGAVVDTVSRSGLTDCTIRPLALFADVVMEVYPGDKPVSVVIGLGDASILSKPLTVKVSAIRKIDQLSMPVKAKVSANYIGPMMAKTEAVRAGFDDTIILDREGYVAEGSTSNIFIVEDGTLITAPEDSILPGITRDTIFTIADSVGVETRFERFTPERMRSADEVILSSSGKGVAPVIRVDDTVIGDGLLGPVAKKLGDFYTDVVTGNVPEFEHWLTYV